MVYFFRSKDVLDIPRKNIVMLFKNLLGNEVSFRQHSGWRKGILKEINMEQSSIIPQFFIEGRKGVMHTVAFFDLFLTTQQAKQVLPENHSQSSLFSL